MGGLLFGMHLFLLQADEQWFKDDNPMEGMIVLFGIGAVILVAVLSRVFRRATTSTAIAGKGGGSKANFSTSRKFSIFTLHRIASTYGLDREQTKLLEYVFRNDAVSDPERVIKNHTLLDRHFKRTYKTIERNSETDEEAQQKLAKLFSLRNAIEAAPETEDDPSSHLAANTPAVLTVNKESYSVKVISSRTQNVTIELPRNVLGTPVRLSKGTRVSLSFFTKSSKGFSVEGQVSGIADTNGQGQGLQIAHSGRIKALTGRRFRRRQTSVRCDFFLVNIVETGKKTPPKLVVDKRLFKGMVMDISVGGCSLKTAAAVPVGSRLKISIDHTDHNPINVLGQVLRANRSGAAGNTILHIKFLKVPLRAFNSISTLVFGYADDIR
jgi:hypothetical protein